MFKLFKQNLTKEESFWRWINKNQKKLSQIKSGNDPLYAEANTKLKEYNPELVFEVCGNEFIISANGDKKEFASVLNLCDSSPKTKKFKVTAFRQPQGFFSLNYAGVEVNYEDVYFSYTQEKNALDLQIYHKDFNEETRSQIGGAIFIILDHGIGEYDVETKLRYIDFNTLEKEENLLNISELKEIIDKI
ncbi:MAG: hypothetical protein NE330_17675 [Lentisphaeraceae bacterium]|nr:hypothetical protein [Lentisphaeraceae bacterium]